MKLELLTTDSKLINDNHLLNGDFQINQRGQSSYENISAVCKYTIDLWFLLWGKVEVLSKGIRLSTTGSNAYLQQFLDEDYTDTKITIGAKVDGQVYSTSGVVNKSQGISKNFGSFALAFDYYTSNNSYKFQIRTESKKSIDIEFAFLYVGNINYQHKREDYGIAIMRCSPIIESIFGLFNSTYSSPTNAGFVYNYRVKKKRKPEVSVDNKQLSGSLGEALSNVKYKGVEESLVDRCRWAYDFDEKNCPHFYNYVVIVASCEKLL